MTTEPTLLSFITERHIKPFDENVHEIVATDALGFILRRSGAARQGLTDVLDDGMPGLTPIATVKTQVTGADNERPDFECRDNHDNPVALIEAKIWGEPTPNQAITYWESPLIKDTPSALVFLVATRRLDNWRQVLTQSLGRESLKPVNSTPNLVSMRDMNSRRCLIIISWDELLCRLEDAAKSNKDCQTSIEVAQLRSLVKTTSSKVGLCLYGCGKQPKGRKSKYCIDHSSKVASLLNTASKARPPYPETVRLPAVLAACPRNAVGGLERYDGRSPVVRSQR